MVRTPEFIDPMLVILVRAQFDNADFLFEIKWDGVGYLESRRRCPR